MPRKAKSSRTPKICKYGDPMCPCPDGDKCHYEGAHGWLLPCPFCGGDAKMHHRDEDDADFIECTKCGASTNLQYSVKDDGRPRLVERWNSRSPTMTAPEDQICICGHSRTQHADDLDYGCLAEIEDEVSCKCDRFITESYCLGELLAVIHRDGGQHKAAHEQKASTDAAINIVLRERLRLECWATLLKDLHGHIAGEVGERLDKAVTELKAVSEK